MCEAGEKEIRQCEALAKALLGARASNGRCGYHDDLVVAVGSLGSKIDAMREDLLEIKDDLYVANNGGVVGWMYRRKGSRAVVTFIIPIAFSAATTFAVILVNHMIAK